VALGWMGERKREREQHCIVYLVGGLVVHDELSVDEVEAVRLGLERVVDHVFYCENKHAKPDEHREFGSLCKQARNPNMC